MSHFSPQKGILPTCKMPCLATSGSLTALIGYTTRCQSGSCSAPRPNVQGCDPLSNLYFNNEFYKDITGYGKTTSLKPRPYIKKYQSTPDTSSTPPPLECSVTSDCSTGQGTMNTYLQGATPIFDETYQPKEVGKVTYQCQEQKCTPVCKSEYESNLTDANSVACSISKPVCNPPCVNGTCNHGNTCTCNLGWQGDTCNKCAVGFWGTSCSPCPGQSAQSICSDHGTCSDGISGTGKCTCTSGWGGTDCDKCAGHGTWDESSNTCTCEKGTGWSGNNCDTCASGWGGTDCDKCSGHGTWNETTKCTCENGYYGTGTDTCNLKKNNGKSCKDDGECTSTHCTNGVCCVTSDCKNGDCSASGDGTCKCYGGWQGILDTGQRPYGTWRLGTDSESLQCTRCASGWDVGKGGTVYQCNDCASGYYMEKQAGCTTSKKCGNPCWDDGLGRNRMCGIETGNWVCPGGDDVCRHKTLACEKNTNNTADSCSTWPWQDHWCGPGGSWYKSAQ